MQVESCEISPSNEAERNSPRILILPWRLSQRGTEYAVTMISGSEKLQKDNDFHKILDESSKFYNHAQRKTLVMRVQIKT